MSRIDSLLEKNRDWATRIQETRPGFFESLSLQQTPKYLWIGCSDSRVPANEIVGLAPGEVFVHRNIANLVVHTDLNCLAVIQYAVDVLQVEDIMVVGHHGCGGVLAALRGQRVGLADHWLRHIEDLAQVHRRRLSQEHLEEVRANRLCELNVVEQVCNVSRLGIVQDAWRRGQRLAVHGLVYSLRDGLLRELGAQIDRNQDLIAWRRDCLLKVWLEHRSHP